MLKHIIFLLYLLSYTAGIGAITLGSFLYYFKLRSDALKYFLFADLFLTMTLSLNTLHYYESLFHFSDQRFISISLAYGLLFAAIGTIWFLTLVVSTLIDDRASKRKKTMYFALATLAISMLLGLHIMNIYKVLDDRIAIHSAYLLSTIFLAVGIGYNAVLLAKNMNKITGEVKLLVTVMRAVALTVVSAAVVSDLLEYIWRPEYPIAFSPFLYFMVNLISIVFAIKHFWGKSLDVTKETVNLHMDCQPDYGKFCQTYNITERELEIILLIVVGNSNQDIGKILFISVNTVRNHIYNIYKKVGVKKRYELIHMLQV